jgi:hypothetical protein
MIDAMLDDLPAICWGMLLGALFAVLVIGLLSARPIRTSAWPRDEHARRRSRLARARVVDGPYRTSGRARRRGDP